MIALFRTLSARVITRWLAARVDKVGSGTPKVAKAIGALL